MNNEQPRLNLEEINEAWIELLSLLVIAKRTLTKQYRQLQSESEKIIAENDELKSQLHQTQCDLLAAQGKAIIDDNDN